MKKLALILVTLLILAGSPAARAQELATTIKVQAMDMATAFMKNDFNTFARFMHPNIIAFAGGKEQMKTKMDSAYNAMKRFGVTFKRYWIGNPGKIITLKNQLQAVLPGSISLKTPLGEVITETSMIVISNDKGKNWYFIDTNVYKADKLKDILPELSSALNIPPGKKPRLVPMGEN